MKDLYLSLPFLHTTEGVSNPICHISKIFRRWETRRPARDETGSIIVVTIGDSKTRFIRLRSRLFIRCGGQCIKTLVTLINARADVVLSLVVTWLHKRGVSRRVLMSFAARRGEAGTETAQGVTRRDAHRSRWFLFLVLAFIVTHPIVHRSRAWSNKKRSLLPRTFAAPMRRSYLIPVLNCAVRRRIKKPIVICDNSSFACEQYRLK